MNGLVLSLFPGIGLLDTAFERKGFTVVRGPDILWGGDISRFSVPQGKFDGIIGGPPCQPHSTAGCITGTQKIDLIPEFVRVVNEAKPEWVVMENVRGAAGHKSVPPDWYPCKLRDKECGGLTSRTRLFWTWPFMCFDCASGGGKASHSVMATTWKRGKSTSRYVTDKGFLPGDLSIQEYARLQGVPEIGDRLVEHKASKAFAVHCLGNGVPLAMGLRIAESVLEWKRYQSR
jgi:DNA (cytosine-5)-methyltransferase 1